MAVTLPDVVLTPGDFALIFRHGALDSVQLLDGAMAKLHAAGYVRTMPIALTVVQGLAEVTLVVRPAVVH